MGYMAKLGEWSSVSDLNAKSKTSILGYTKDWKLMCVLRDRFHKTAGVSADLYWGIIHGNLPKPRKDELRVPIHGCAMTIWKKRYNA